MSHDCYDWAARCICRYSSGVSRVSTFTNRQRLIRNLQYRLLQRSCRTRRQTCGCERAQYLPSCSHRRVFQFETTTNPTARYNPHTVAFLSANSYCNTYCHLFEAAARASSQNAISSSVACRKMCASSCFRSADTACLLARSSRAAIDQEKDRQPLRWLRRFRGSQADTGWNSPRPVATAFWYSS